MWSTTEDGRIELGDGPVANPQELLEQWKGMRIEGKPPFYSEDVSGLSRANLGDCLAIIERVISGDRVAVRLLLQPKIHRQLVVLLAGIRCPRSGYEGGEEFGDEAKNTVESALIQRTVDVELLGLTTQSQFIGIISHTRGNITEQLLQEGLGRCEDFHSTLLGARMIRLRAAEKRAKDAKLRLWKGHVVKKLDNTNSFDAVVARIIWADQFIIRNKAGQEKKISLSSIRAPKYASLSDQQLEIEPWEK